jgi:pimeloyl-ACP methyl ester carboxylesterase
MGKFVPVTSSGIAYDRSSSRDHIPLLFIHAGIADRRMWDPQWDALAETWDVARLDLRGFGESGTPPIGPLSPVEDVIAMMDDAALERVHLVAASLGSGVAVEVALTVPDRVASLVLCPPGGSLLSARTDDLRAFGEEENAALDAGDLDAAVEANIRAWVVGPGRTRADVDPDVVAAVRRMQRRAFEIDQVLEDVDRVELAPPALERLDQIQAPTLVLLGGHDLEATKDAAERLCSGIRHVQRIDWPDAAHLPSLEHPDRFTDLLRGWLSPPGPEEKSNPGPCLPPVGLAPSCRRG